jgi:twitching motility protein PilT
VIELNKILRIVEDKKASDLHLTVGQFPIFRTAGNAVIDKAATPFEVTRDDVETALSIILTPEQMTYLKDNWIFDRTYVASHGSSVPVGRYRVHVSKQRDNWDIVFRRLSPRIETIDELHLPPVLKRVVEEYSYGFIMITGLAGVGKSTSLAAMVEHINQNIEGKCITIIEDPREFFFEDQKSFIKQKAMNDDVRSLPLAIRNSLRENIDVLCVGELKEPMAIRDALRVSAFCLVITTFHGYSAEAAINRLIYAVPEMEQEEARATLASNMRAVVCQRLLRATSPEGTKVPAAEVVLNTASIADYIRKNETYKIYDYIRQHGANTEMKLMKDSIFALYEKGLVSKEEAINVAPSAAEMKELIEGVVVGYEIFETTAPPNEKDSRTGFVIPQRKPRVPE